MLDGIKAIWLNLNTLCFGSFISWVLVFYVWNLLACKLCSDELAGISSHSSARERRLCKGHLHNTINQVPVRFAHICLPIARHLVWLAWFTNDQGCNPHSCCWGNWENFIFLCTSCLLQLWERKFKIYGDMIEIGTSMSKVRGTVHTVHLFGL